MNLLSALDAPAAEEPNDEAKATPEEAGGHEQQTAGNPRY
jgi:jasmonate ZIM domain-containing protein